MAENESVATRMYEAMAAANASDKKVERLMKEKEQTEDRMEKIENILTDFLRTIRSSLDLCLSKFDETTTILENLVDRVETLENRIENCLKNPTTSDRFGGSSDEMRQLLLVIGTKAVPEVRGIEKRPVVHPSTYAGSSQFYCPLQDFGPVYKSDLTPFFNKNEPMIFYTKSRFPPGRKCLPVHYQDPELVIEEAPGGIKGLWKMVTSSRPTMDVKQYDSLEVASYNERLVRWIIFFGGQIYNVSHLLEQGFTYLGGEIFKFQDFPLYLRICNDEKKQKFSEKELAMMTSNFVGELVGLQSKPDTSVQERLEVLTKKIEGIEVLLKQKPKEK